MPNPAGHTKPLDTCSECNTGHHEPSGSHAMSCPQYRINLTRLREALKQPTPYDDAVGRLHELHNYTLPALLEAVEAMMQWQYAQGMRENRRGRIRWEKAMEFFEEGFEFERYAG